MINKCPIRRIEGAYMYRNLQNRCKFVREKKCGLKFKAGTIGKVPYAGIEAGCEWKNKVEC